MVCRGSGRPTNLAESHCSQQPPRSDKREVMLRSNERSLGEVHGGEGVLEGARGDESVLGAARGHCGIKLGFRFFGPFYSLFTVAAKKAIRWAGPGLGG